MLRIPEYAGTLKSCLTSEDFNNQTNRALFSYIRAQPNGHFLDEGSYTVEPSFFETALSPEDVEVYLKSEKIPYQRGELYRLLSRVQLSSAINLDADSVLENLLKQKYEKTVMEFNQHIMAALDGNRIGVATDLLEDFYKTHALRNHSQVTGDKDRKA